DLAPAIEGDGADDELLRFLRVGDWLVHRGEEWAGTDGVHRDVERRELETECPRELHDGPFARCVRSAVREADDAERAGHVDDPSPLLLFEERNDGAGAQPGAMNIDVLNLLELVVSELVNRPADID